MGGYGLRTGLKQEIREKRSEGESEDCTSHAQGILILVLLVCLASSSSYLKMLWPKTAITELVDCPDVNTLNCPELSSGLPQVN